MMGGKRMSTGAIGSELRERQRKQSLKEGVREKKLILFTMKPSRYFLVVAVVVALVEKNSSSRQV